MKKVLIGLLAAALVFSAYSIGASAAKKKAKFGVARVQGVEPSVSIESGIAEPKKLGFDMRVPKHADLELSWSLHCWNKETQWTDDHTTTIGADDIVQGDIATSFSPDVYGAADACTLAVDAKSAGTGEMSLSFRGAGDVPAEPAPIEPAPEPTETP